MAGFGFSISRTFHLFENRNNINCRIDKFWNFDNKYKERKTGKII